MNWCVVVDNWCVVVDDEYLDSITVYGPYTYDDAVDQESKIINSDMFEAPLPLIRIVKMERT